MALVSRLLRATYRMASSSLCTFAANPVNEPVYSYVQGSDELKKLRHALEQMESTVQKVPIVIGDEELESADVRYQRMPFDHQRKLAQFYYADKDQLNKAIQVGLAAREGWMRRPLRERAEVMFKAAELLQGKYRYDINAAAMLGQGKTIVQAEIDAACELVDFLKFNAANALTIEKCDLISPAGVKNTMTYRPLEGFVASIAPFNFAAIAGNLMATPAMMGNAVIFKPSDTAVLSNYVAFKVLREAGVPPGVINFVPADGPTFGDVITASPHLACINFTGSVPTFQHLWKLVGQNIDKYDTFPRLIGECGGKNFHFVHASADVESVANASIRSAFEYSGQKCSACGRMYVPESIWPALKARLVQIHSQIKYGSPLDVGNFMTSVIDDRAYARLSGILQRIKDDHAGQFELIAGGGYDDSKGYFIEPTIVVVKNAADSILTEEYFGPIMSIFVYPDDDGRKILSSLKNATRFGLTGAVFAQDRDFLDWATDVLRDAVGNFYLNDKSTGSVVGQQPFGGARKSGTNDKAGGPHYVLRYASPMATKESLVPISEWDYPYMRP